jgi:hypothetical protein
MEMRDIPILHWTYTLEIATILWAHSRDFYVIWRNHQCHHPNIFFMVMGVHLFIVLFFMGAKYVCKDYEPHPRSPYPQFLFHPFCMFSLIIAGRTTSVDL